MKLSSKFSILGYVASITYASVDIIQYWIRFPDPDKLMANLAIASLIFAVSWLYNQNLDKTNRLRAIEDYLSDKQDKEAENEENN